MFKVICVSNYDLETVDDILICENVTEHIGKRIADALNDKYSDDESDDYYICVSNDYTLYKFEI